MVDHGPEVLPEPVARTWDFARSSAGVAHLVTWAAAHGLPPERALAGTGLGPADLRVAGLEVTAAQELGVVRTLQRHLARGASAGAEVGASYGVASFGAFGWALLSSRTLLDALVVALRYLDLSFAFALPRADLDGTDVVVTVDGTSLPGDVREFLVLRDATAVRTVLDELLDGLDLVVEVGPERAVLRLGAHHLARELSRADPRLAALAEELCHDVVERRRARTGIAQQTRVHVLQRLPSGAPMAQVVRDLGLSERSLRRRLAASGTSYQALLDEVRESVAAELLGAGLPVRDVAQRLGYAGSTSFIHAHRRWTGRTPGAPSTSSG